MWMQLLIHVLISVLVCANFVSKRCSCITRTLFPMSQQHVSVRQLGVILYEHSQAGIMIWICNDILIALCAKYMLIHSITLTDVQFNYRWLSNHWCSLYFEGKGNMVFKMNIDNPLPCPISAVFYNWLLINNDIQTTLKLKTWIK